MKTHAAKLMLGLALCVADISRASTGRLTINPAGSDPAAAYFQNNVLPGIQSMVSANWPSGSSVPASCAIDPANLRVVTTGPVRVYLVSASSGDQDTLGYNAAGIGTSSGDPQVITKNTSMPPLNAGDFASLGTFSSGTVLDFYLIVNSTKDTYSTLQPANPDGVTHVVSMSSAVNAYQSDSGYLILGFEGGKDQGRKDFDYSDVVIAVEGLAVASPEPALWVTLGSFILIAAGIRHRRRSHTLGSAV